MKFQDFRVNVPIPFQSDFKALVNRCLRQGPHLSPWVGLNLKSNFKAEILAWGGRSPAIRPVLNGAADSLSGNAKWPANPDGVSRHFSFKSHQQRGKDDCFAQGGVVSVKIGCSIVFRYRREAMSS